MPMAVRHREGTEIQIQHGQTKRLPSQQTVVTNRIKGDPTAPKNGIKKILIPSVTSTVIEAPAATRMKRRQRTARKRRPVKHPRRLPLTITITTHHTTTLGVTRPIMARATTSTPRSRSAATWFPRTAIEELICIQTFPPATLIEGLRRHLDEICGLSVNWFINYIRRRCSTVCVCVCFNFSLLITGREPAVFSREKSSF